MSSTCLESDLILSTRSLTVLSEIPFLIIVENKSFFFFSGVHISAMHLYLPLSQIFLISPIH